MINYFKVDTQALFDIARCAEEQPDHLFKMNEWLQETNCGTAGCLIGSWYLRSPQNCVLPHYWDGNNARFNFDDIAKRLKLPMHIVEFIFCDHSEFIGCNKVLYSSPKQWVSDSTYISRVSNAIYLNKEQALKRLRKVLYYILHKREVLGDYEKARRTGDIGIVNKVHESLEEVLV